MLDKLIWKPFSEVDITDNFFDSLRSDYGNEKFDNWFLGKAEKGEQALTLIENEKVSLTSFFLVEYTMINPLNMKNISTPDSPFPNNRSPKSF